MLIKEIAKDEVSREVFWEVNRDGIIKEVTSNCFDILGYNKEELIDTDFNHLVRLDKIHKFDLRNCKEKNIEVEIIHKKHKHKYVDLSIKELVDEKQEKLGFIISMIDISKYRRIQDREKRLIKLLENEKDIIYRYEIYPEIKFGYLSRAVEEVLGQDLESHYEDPMIPFRLVHPEDYNTLYDKVTGKTDFSKPILTRWKGKGGKYIWFEEYATPLYDEEGTFIGVEGICRNIQERMALHDQLKYLSYHDILTGTYNRTYFEIQKERVNSIDKSVGIIVCDLDNLKDVNDTLGHPQGDFLIKKAAEIITKTVKEKNIVARIGGDEFVILLEYISRKETIDTINNLQKTLERYNRRRKVIPLRMSIGFEYRERAIGTVDDVFNNADRNMYYEKVKRKLGS